jgi:hypothetical protein
MNPTSRETKLGSVPAGFSMTLEVSYGTPRRTFPTARENAPIPVFLSSAVSGESL